MKSHDVKTEQGFTLIEIMVAMLIASVTLLGLGAFTIAVLSQDNVARQRAVATHLGEQMVDEWMGTTQLPAPFGAQPVDPTTDGTPGPAVVVVQPASPNTLNTAYTLSATVNTLALNGAPQQLALTVSWTNKGINHQIILTSMPMAP